MSFDSEVMAFTQYAEVTGGNPPVFLQNRGFSAIARNGTGDYTLTLETNEGLDDSIMGVFLQVKGATPLLISYVHTSNTQIQVLAETDLGVAAEVSFNILVMRPAGAN